MNGGFSRIALALGLLAVTPSASAQLLPRAGQTLDTMGSTVSETLGRVRGTLGGLDMDRLAPAQLADRLVAARAARIARLLRRHGDVIELDDRRAPARRGVILLTGAGDRVLAALRSVGYGVAREQVDGLDLSVARLTLPAGRSLSDALKQVRKIAPEAQACADNIYLPGGDLAGTLRVPLADDRRDGGSSAAIAGVIDGGAARHPALSGPVEQRGFARGAPLASAHGTAVASLMVGKGAVQGAAPGAPLLLADVYGDDPAGGGALAIARALGWMAARRVRVVTISLVGPDNPVLAGAIQRATEKGVTVVAAVGNDGPAAPPAYPASYARVVAVTGIDGRGRLLPESGRALHVDFAAPGADMNAASADGGKRAVRGTSFSAPLVAGRLLAVGGIAALRSEAKAGRKGMGAGIICGDCKNTD
ncbi:MAG: S8 family serine peptidase [Sphingobium sp.]